MPISGRAEIGKQDMARISIRFANREPGTSFESPPQFNLVPLGPPAGGKGSFEVDQIRGVPNSRSAREKHSKLDFIFEGRSEQKILPSIGGKRGLDGFFSVMIGSDFSLMVRKIVSRLSKVCFREENDQRVWFCLKIGPLPFSRFLLSLPWKFSELNIFLQTF